MFENIIKDAFAVQDSSDDEDDKNTYISQTEWYNKVMGIYD